MNLEQKLTRNIHLSYVLASLNTAWFWIAIWVLYYVRFTDFAGIGLLESSLFVTIVLAEIPTGAIADMLGKKKTLILALLLGALGNFIIGITPNFQFLVVGLLIAGLDVALTSGSFEALVYDSLLSLKQASRFEQVLAHHETLKLLTLAGASIMGGLMYAYSPQLPFIAFAFVKLIAAFIAFFLSEPPIDSETFSWSNYLNQTKHGFKELAKTPEIAQTSLILLILTAFIVINHELLIDIQLVARGWSEERLGILVAVMSLCTAVVAQTTPYFSRLLGRQRANILSALAIAITMIVIPWLGMFIASAIIILRNSLMSIFKTTSSSLINKNTASKYRATTLSTFNMIATLPYVLSAYLIGRSIDSWGIDGVVLSLGLGLALCALSSLGISFLSVKKK